MPTKEELQEMQDALDNIQDAVDAGSDHDVVAWLDQLKEYAEEALGKATGKF